MSDTIIEKQRELNIIENVDILVAGGGTAGSIAAIAAARSGVSVLIVEQFGSLGGTATNALVTPLMSSEIEGNPMCSAISDEINSRMNELGCFAVAKDNCSYFDPAILKIVLEEMVLEANVKLLYYTYICDVIIDGDRISGVIVENKAGRSAIRAKCVIDCSGDADIASRAGVEIYKGNPATGKNQPMSVRYMLAGVNLAIFAQFMKKMCDGKSRFHYHFEDSFFHVAVVWGKNWPMEPIFKDALTAGDITYNDGLYWQLFSVPGRTDALAFNCPEIFEGVDGTNPYDLTNAQIYAKKAILRHLKFYKKYLPGFENSYVTEIANQVGVRESNRIKGAYTLTDEDMLLYRKFEDSIAKSNYPLDVHGIELMNGRIDMKDKDEVPYYDIPYMCLVPANIKGLLVAGRCISATFIAQSSLRIQPTVRAIGEAAGIAAGMSINRDIELLQIKGQEVREEMVKRGAIFPK